MDAHTAARGHYIDMEVVKRLLKGVDFLVLTLGAIVLPAVMAPQTGDDGRVAIEIGFFAAVLSLGSILVMRGLELYEPKALSAGLRSAGLSFACCILTGAVLQAAVGLFALGPGAPATLPHLAGAGHRTSGDHQQPGP